MTNLTRRQLAQLAVGSAVSAVALAQTTPDWLKQAADSKRAAADDLAKVDIEIAVEPAFQFKA